MHPVLFSIGKFSFYSYGFMIAVGIICALTLAMYRAEKFGLNKDIMFDIGIYGLIGGIIGAKLLFLIAEAPYAFKHPEEIKNLLTAGFVIYGALIGGVIAAFIYCRTKKQDFLKYFDLAIPSVAVAQGFGRIGCFLAGCCYGKETSSAIGIVFSHSDYAPNGVKLIPTQLISSAGNFLIAAVLLVFASKSKKKGQTAGLYMILYSIGRFIIEIFRDDPRGNVGPLSTSQFICIFVLIGGIILFNLNRYKFPEE